ncbi:MAG: hypothetical protein QM572_05800 [Nocardioides sp.]|uniref:hypothetical protein n=1 Tax=Nocardioides sp. TaxID=35761 RepID=UPI0039E2E70E
MTDAPIAPIASAPKVGETIHFLVSGWTFHNVVKHQFTGVVSRRGDELVVSKSLIEANTDRFGQLAAWLALVHDPEAQIRRFGMQVVGVGGFPRHFVSTTPGELEHDEERRARVSAANQITDPKERKAALAEIESVYGPAAPTSRSLGTYSGKH